MFCSLLKFNVATGKTPEEGEEMEGMASSCVLLMESQKCRMPGPRGYVSHFPAATTYLHLRHTDTHKHAHTHTLTHTHNTHTQFEKKIPCENKAEDTCTADL